MQINSPKPKHEAFGTREWPANILYKVVRIWNLPPFFLLVFFFFACIVVVDVHLCVCVYVYVLFVFGALH